MKDFLSWDNQTFGLLSPEQKFDLFREVLQEYNDLKRRVRQIDDIVGIMTDRSSREDDR